MNGGETRPRQGEGISKGFLQMLLLGGRCSYDGVGGVLITGSRSGGVVLLLFLSIVLAYWFVLVGLLNLFEGRNGRRCLSLSWVVSL